MQRKRKWAYIIGVALGDGNLSKPNGRAVRLRITCDARYPQVANEIAEALKKVLPTNAVSIVRGPKDTYFNISVYSNKLTEWIPWKVGRGSKIDQNIRVPNWIRESQSFTRACLRGLLQTDGSIYVDRGYTMLNFCNVVKPLALDVHTMLKAIGFQPTFTQTLDRKRIKYTVRVAKDCNRLVKDLHFYKA